MENIKQILYDHNRDMYEHYINWITPSFIGFLTADEIITKFKIKLNNLEKEQLISYLSEISNSKDFKKLKYLQILKDNWILPTSSNSLNSVLNNGGLRSGEITLIYGKAKTGKTQFSHNIIVDAYKMFYPKLKKGFVAYIDTEQSFRPSRIIQICESKGIQKKDILEKIEIISINESHELFRILNNIENYLNSKSMKILIIDSLTKVFRLALSRNPDMYLSIISNLNEILTLLVQIAKENNIPILCTSQVTATFEKSYFFEILPILSSTLNYYIKHCILFSFPEELQDFKEFQGLRYARLINGSLTPEKISKFYISTGGLVDIRQE